MVGRISGTCKGDYMSKHTMIVSLLVLAACNHPTLSDDLPVWNRTIEVVNPEGLSGTIPEDQKEEALKQHFYIQGSTPALGCSWNGNLADEQQVGLMPGSHGGVRWAAVQLTPFETKQETPEQTKTSDIDLSPEGYTRVVDPKSGKEIQILSTPESVKSARDKGYPLASEWNAYIEHQKQEQQCINLKRELGYSEKEIESGYTGTPKIPSKNWNGEWRVDTTDHGYVSSYPVIEERKRNPPLGQILNRICGIKSETDLNPAVIKTIKRNTNVQTDLDIPLDPSVIKALKHN